MRNFFKIILNSLNLNLLGLSLAKVEVYSLINHNRRRLSGIPLLIFKSTGESDLHLIPFKRTYRCSDV